MLQITRAASSEELDEMELQPLIPMRDSARVLESMQAMSCSPKSTRLLIRRFGGTRSLTFAFAIAAIAGVRIRARVLRDSYVVGGQLWRLLRFRHHSVLLAQIVGSFAHLAASIPPQRKAEIDLCCDVCRVSLEVCQIDDSQHRSVDARDLYERVEALLAAIPLNSTMLVGLQTEARRVGLLLDLTERSQ